MADDDTFIRLGGWGRLGFTLILAIVVHASTIQVIDYWFEARGYVSRADLVDVRSPEYFGTLLVGECRPWIGQVRISVLERSPAEVRETMIHEFFHCVVVPRLGASADEVFGQYYLVDATTRGTDAQDAEEWAAQEFAEWCVDPPGHPQVLEATRSYLELWGCVPPMNITQVI